jgi:hypothetical protein
MKRNELKQLYNYYVQHTAVVEKMGSVEEIKEYLKDKRLSKGFNTASFQRHGFILFEPLNYFPQEYNYKTQIVKVLKLRIELLRSELLKNMQNFVDQLPSGLCKVDFDYLEYRGEGLEIDICDDEIRLKGNSKYLILWVEN